FLLTLLEGDAHRPPRDLCLLYSHSNNGARFQGFRQGRHAARGSIQRLLVGLHLRSASLRSSGQAEGGPYKDYLQGLKPAGRQRLTWGPKPPLHRERSPKTAAIRTQTKLGYQRGSRGWRADSR